jgi:hypothetical protein
MNHRTPSSRWLSALLVALVASVAMIPAASADNVDKLVSDLKSSSDYKVRLSAAASLAKIGTDDKRAVDAFIDRLGKDKEKTVRGAAAVGLGKVVTADTAAKLRTAAMSALDKATKDKDSFVKKQAKKALDKLKKLDGGGGTVVAAGGIYVNIGAMAAETKDADKMKALMKKTVERTFSKSATDIKTGTPPTSLKGVQAFYVDGTLNEVTTKAKGSATIVSCKVNMYIATYPDNSVFGFLNGGGSVQASSDAKDVELAKTDCVDAVVEDLVIKKIIPTIRSKAGR